MKERTEKTAPDDAARVDECKKAYHRIRDELAKVIVGQDEVIEQVLIATFSRGHALLEGVPGLASGKENRCGRRRRRRRSRVDPPEVLRRVVYFPDRMIPRGWSRVWGPV